MKVQGQTTASQSVGTALAWPAGRRCFAALALAMLVFLAVWLLSAGSAAAFTMSQSGLQTVISSGDGTDAVHVEADIPVIAYGECGSESVTRCLGNIRITPVKRPLLRTLGQGLSISPGKTKTVRLRVPSGKPKTVTVTVALRDSAGHAQYSQRSYRTRTKPAVAKKRAVKKKTTRKTVAKKKAGV
jgi:hypothetical protein